MPADSALADMQRRELRRRHRQHADLRPADLPRVLTFSGAVRLGMTKARVDTEVRRGRWQRLGPGVLLTRPESPTRNDWMLAGTTIGGPGSVVSGWDVVRLHGLGPAEPVAPTVLVLTRQGRNRVIGGVHVRPSPRPVRANVISELDATLAGLRVATMARAVCDTCLAMRQVAPVRAMVTSAVQRNLATVDDLLIELMRGPRNGSAPLRRALRDAGIGAASIAEAEAAELLTRAGLTGFVANAPILDDSGRTIYVADFLWPRLRAIVEIDSREFHFTELDWKRTMRRHNDLTARGYAVAHYPPSDVRERRLDWAHEVAVWLAERSRELDSRR